MIVIRFNAYKALLITDYGEIPLSWLQFTELEEGFKKIRKLQENKCLEGQIIVSPQQPT